MSKIKLGSKEIFNSSKPYFIAEIGINHNGDIKNALELINACRDAGADAVKFQKRTVDVVYSAEELAKPRDSVFGNTNGDLKRGLEFGRQEYDQINKLCKKINIDWFASCWDEESVDFFDVYDLPCYKLASASITDKNLLMRHKKKNKPIILSTGMSTENEIDKAIEVFDKERLIILHCTSSYPCKLEELNLNVIKSLSEKYDCIIGYSGHEVGLSTTLAAYVLGARVLERHVTLDRSQWGSDQSASIEPQGLKKLIRDINTIYNSLGDGVKKVYDSEKPIIEKLRRKNTI